MKEKLTNKKKVARRHIVYMDLCRGKTQHDIIEKWSKEWHCSKSEVRAAISDAIEKLQDVNGIYTDTMRDINIERLTILYDKALESGNIKEAKLIIDLLNKTCGVYTDKIEVTGSTTFNFAFGDEVKEEKEEDKTIEDEDDEDEEE